MKCAIVIADGLKQVMFSPESPEERAALALFDPNQDITVDIKRGHFCNGMTEATAHYTVHESQGGYLRMFESAESLMLVLRPKAKPEGAAG